MRGEGNLYGSRLAASLDYRSEGAIREWSLMQSTLIPLRQRRGGTEHAFRPCMD